MEFIRNTIGLNSNNEETIFQHTLAVIGFECYLTIDIDNLGEVKNEYYTRPQGKAKWGDKDNEKIIWKK